MVLRIIGVVFIVLSLYQGYATYNMFKHIQQKWTSETSYFVGVGIWSSVFFAALLFGFGLALSLGFLTF